jgi:hypothetical protein
MSICPHCRKRYEDWVVTCPSCNLPLVEDSDRGERRNVGKYVPLKSLPSRLYAEMLKEILEQEGIPCLIKGEDLGGMLGGGAAFEPVEIMLWVPEEDYERGLEIAESIVDDI